MDEQKLQDTLEFLRSMSEAELEVAALYEACQQRWPQENIWGELRVQELQHAAGALRLKTLVREEPTAYNSMRPLNSRNVDAFIKAVHAAADKVRSRGYDLRQALAAAKDIENSILEARYDQVLSTQKAEFIKVIGVLHRESRLHKEMLQARLMQLEHTK